MTSNMSKPVETNEGHDLAQFARFVANGFAAAAVHFAVLYTTLEIIGVRSAGVANFIAALFGTSLSFVGSRYFVFRAASQPVAGQAARFGGLYLATATLHGAVLYAWTDVAGHDYRVGFLLATALQVVLSYLGSKHLIFNDGRSP